MQTSFKNILNLATLLLAIWTTASCSDNESFTTDPSVKLICSEDTVRFDTLITGQKSSTKRIVLFNPSKKGVVITSARLSSGNGSGFHMVMDGITGSSVSNIEVFGEDSISVFLAITPPIRNLDEPQLIRDTLLCTLQSGITQGIILEAHGQDAYTLMTDSITADTTIISARPILVRKSFSVGPDAKLTIGAGTQLYFHEGTGMDVYGTIDIQGTLNEPVVMRGDRTDHLFSYLPYDRTDRQWNGIRLLETSRENKITDADIHGAIYGIMCDSTGTDVQKLRITNSVIHNIREHALSLTCCKAEVENCQLSNAGGCCLFVSGGDVSVLHTTIAQFYPWRSHTAALRFDNYSGELIHPLERFVVRNSIITGSYNDEIHWAPRMDSVDESPTPFNFSIESSLVLTDSTGFSANFVDCTFENADSAAYRETNFETIDKKIFYYDFSLTEGSQARGIANPAYSVAVPFDRKGIERPSTGADAGCLQYVKKEEKEEDK